MIAFRQFVARVVLVAIVCVLATTWLGWRALPFVGVVFGLADRRARAPGAVAALAAVVGWLAILCAAAVRGADIRAVAAQVGAVMQMPGAAFIVVALVFAALLCGTAAVLGAAIARVALARRSAI